MSLFKLINHKTLLATSYLATVRFRRWTLFKGQRWLGAEFYALLVLLIGNVYKNTSLRFALHPPTQPYLYSSYKTLLLLLRLIKYRG